MTSCFISMYVTDDYGNQIKFIAVSEYDQYIVSTNTYGGYDLYHSYLMDAEI